MKKTDVSLSVAVVTDTCKQLLQEKGFILFCDIDHQDNAARIKMAMPAARTLIFGKPEAGTQLMQQDIHASFDLPLRVAIVENRANADTAVLIHPEARDFSANYALDESHPVLQAVDALFAAIIEKLNSRVA